jgi:hypothetical protein
VVLSNSHMKREITFTILWMLGFAAAVFVVWGATLVPLAQTHRQLFAVMYLDVIFKAVFFVSPLVALWLGWRGALPGTRRNGETDVA